MDGWVDGWMKEGRKQRGRKREGLWKDGNKEQNVDMFAKWM